MYILKPPKSKNLPLQKQSINQKNYDGIYNLKKLKETMSL